MIVDDREENRYVLERILGNAGYACQGVDRGSRALELALTGPDLIILDVQLPDMSGYDVCRKLKSDPATSSVMILQVSASFVSNDDRVKALDAGADAYITHPIDRMVLVATVRALMRLRSAETSSRRSSEQWQTTFDSLSEGVALIDKQGCVLRWNNAFLGLCGDKAELRTGEDAALLLERMIGTSEPLNVNGQRFRAEYPCGKRTLQVSVNRIDGDAAEGEKVLILSDTTDRKLAEHALRMAERLSASGKMANAIAHEINNPLEALTNLVFLARASDSVERMQPLLESAAKELDRVARITKQSLSFHRDTDKPIEIDLGELLADVIGMMDRTAALHRVRLTFQRRPAGDVRGFPGQLVQVFSNLIRNAIEVSPAGAEVTVRLHTAHREMGRGSRITIHDRGAGIPEEIRANIFDPFFTTKQLRGSGLGLWVSRSLVTRHQGTIRFRSCQLTGKSGTTFEVFLPVIAASVEHAAEPA